MKKILLAAVAALAMVSCSQNEIDGIDNGKQDDRAEIKFGYTPVTRSTVIETGNFSNFIINAYAANETGDYQAGDAEIIKDGGFTKGGNNDWTADENKKYYWPGSGYAHFFGHNSTLSGAAVYSKATYPNVTYTVAAAVADQEDFLVAKSLNTKQASTVTLNFKHALTQVLFKLQGEDSDLTYTVTKIVVKDVCNKNTYNYQNETWGTAEGTANYTLQPTNAVDVVGSTTEVDFQGENEALILMPQNVANKEIEISYTAKYTDTSAEVAVNSPATVKLSGVWAAGKKITYKLKLSAAEINLIGQIDTPWTNENGTTVAN